MKKLVLMLAVVFSVSLFSCGNGEEKKAADTVDTVAPVAVVEEETAVVVDSAAAPADSAATEAPAEAAK